MKSFKSILAILIVVLMMFSLVACSGDKDTNQENKNTENTTEKKEEFSETTIELDECKIVVLGAEKIIDSEDETGIRVWFDVTNTSEETVYTNYNYECKASQDGYDLNGTFASYETSVDATNVGILRIRPGVTIRAAKEFKMKEDGGTVEISFNNYYSDKEPVVVKFDPKNLPGAPKEFVAEKVEDPQWLKDFSSEGAYEFFGVKYDVKILKVDYAENYEAEKLIRVYYEYKNNSDTAESFNMIFTHGAFQDGIELEINYPETKVPEDDNYVKDIEPGETIVVSYCYKLTSNSPVEVELVDINNGGVGAVFQVE